MTTEKTTEKTKGETRRGASAIEGYTLAFDACSWGVSFCLWEGSALRLRWSSSDDKVWAEDLPSLLESEVAKGGGNFSYRSLHRLCFVRGPGSYTGLRASLSVARGLRLACSGRGAELGSELGSELGLYSVTSFEAGLLSASVGGEYVLSLVESFRGVWYGQAFRDGVAMGVARVLGDAELRLWVFELLEAGGGRLGLCGGGVERACDEVLGSFPKGGFLVGGTGEASDFSRPLAGGEDTIYKRGEAALQPIYMGAAV